MSAEQSAALRGELERARVALYVAISGRAPRRTVDHILERVARLRAACLDAGVAL